MDKKYNKFWRIKTGHNTFFQKEYLWETLPLKIRNIEKKNPEKYIKRIRVKKKKKNSINADNWFDIDLYLNNGLTTIIGNKGSGKKCFGWFYRFYW